MRYTDTELLEYIQKEKCHIQCHYCLYDDWSCCNSKSNTGYGKTLRQAVIASIKAKARRKLETYRHKKDRRA
jgi:hypothetical protein